jgi:hypothetical protein
MLDKESAKWQKCPLEFTGYFGGLSPEMEQEGANFLSPNNVIYHPQLDEDGDGIIDPYVLGKNRAEAFIKHMDRSGLHYDICLGAWNNGLFNYLPEWYIEQHPEILVHDPEGRWIYASMFDKPKPWIGIESREYSDEISKFITGFVHRLGEQDSRLIYWGTGGEMLYPTYVFPDRPSDYSPLAVAHFRGWLRHKYKSIEQLNKQWNRSGDELLEDFSQVKAPQWDEKSPAGLDWHDFRMTAMAEYFQKQYQTFIEAGCEKPVLSLLHGDFFHDRTYAEMGQSPYLMSRVSDGLTTSQILQNSHKPYFNHMYLQYITSTGKLAASQALACVSPPQEGEVVNRSFTTWDARRALYECLGMGIWHAGFVQWKGDLPDGNWQIAGTPAQMEFRQLFAEIEGMRNSMQGMTRLEPELAILNSEAAWILDEWLPEWTEIHRNTIIQHTPYVSLFDQGIEEQLEDGCLRFLVLPYAVYLRPDVEKRLIRFVCEGGFLAIIDDAEQGATGSGHRKMGWLPPFQDWSRAFGQAEDLQRFKIARVKEGNGEVLWIRSKYNRAFLKRIFYAFETQIDHAWKLTVEWFAEKGYVKPVTGIPQNVESFVLSSEKGFRGEQSYTLVFINQALEEQNLEFGMNMNLLGPKMNWEYKELLKEAGQAQKLIGHSLSVIMEPRSVKVIRFTGREEEFGDVVEAEYDGTEQAELFTIHVEEAQNGLVWIRVTDEENKNVSDATVTARIAPLYDYKVEAEYVKEGLYKLELKREELPYVYNAQEQKYKAYEGTVKIKIYAVAGNREGCTVWKIKL